MVSAEQTLPVASITITWSPSLHHLLCPGTWQPLQLALSLHLVQHFLKNPHPSRTHRYFIQCFTNSVHCCQSCSSPQGVDRAAELLPVDGLDFCQLRPSRAFGACGEGEEGGGACVDEEAFFAAAFEDIFGGGGGWEEFVVGRLVWGDASVPVGAEKKLEEVHTFQFCETIKRKPQESDLFKGGGGGWRGGGRSEAVVAANLVFRSRFCPAHRSQDPVPTRLPPSASAQ